MVLFKRVQTILGIPHSQKKCQYMTRESIVHFDPKHLSALSFVGLTSGTRFLNSRVSV
jgi:hypothetical protein